MVFFKESLAPAERAREEMASAPAARGSLWLMGCFAALTRHDQGPFNSGVSNWFDFERGQRRKR